MWHFQTRHFLCCPKSDTAVSLCPVLVLSPVWYNSSMSCWLLFFTKQNKTWQSGIVYNWHWATKTPVIGYGKQRLGQDTETPLNSAEAEVLLLLLEIYCQYQTRKAGSCDHSQPIRGQYPGHVITLHQSEASIQVMWSLSTNQRPVSRSCDHSRPIRGQYPGHVITLHQSDTQSPVWPQTIF